MARRIVITHEPDEHADFWIARVPSLPEGCNFTQGFSLNEALFMGQDLCKVVPEWFKEDGLPIPAEDAPGWAAYWVIDLTDRSVSRD